MEGKFHGKISKNPAITELQQSEPFNRKFLEENHSSN